MSQEYLADLAAIIETSLGDRLLAHDIAHDTLTLTVGRDNILHTLQFLRDDQNLRYEMLLDICGADYPNRPERFEVIYHLLSLSKNRRIRVKVAAAEETPVPSATPLFSSAGWYEREVWDMYGVYFSGHPDLRRILTDYGFDGYPLRKDFPLTGYVEMRWNDEEKRVVYEPVRLTQDFRSFDFLSPWEGMTDIQLPGDEKAVKQAFGAPDRIEEGKL